MRWTSATTAEALTWPSYRADGSQEGSGARTPIGRKSVSTSESPDDPGSASSDMSLETPLSSKIRPRSKQPFGESSAEEDEAVVERLTKMSLETPSLVEPAESPMVKKSKQPFGESSTVESKVVKKLRQMLQPHLMAVFTNADKESILRRQTEATTKALLLMWLICLFKVGKRFTDFDDETRKQAIVNLIHYDPMSSALFDNKVAIENGYDQALKIIGRFTPEEVNDFWEVVMFQENTEWERVKEVVEKHARSER